MFLRPHQCSKDGKDHTYCSLVETVRLGRSLPEPLKSLSKCSADFAIAWTDSERLRSFHVHSV